MAHSYADMITDGTEQLFSVAGSDYTRINRTSQWSSGARSWNDASGWSGSTVPNNSQITDSPLYFDAVIGGGASRAAVTILDINPEVDSVHLIGGGAGDPLLAIPQIRTLTTDGPSGIYFGTVLVQGTWLNGNDIVVDASGELRLAGGQVQLGTIHNSGLIDAVSAGLTSTITSRIFNSGNVQVADGATLVLSDSNFYSSNNITIGDAQSLLHVIGSLTQSGGSTILHGGTLEADDGIIVNAGLVGGTGTIAGNVTLNGGSLKVGASPDPLHITGNYSQTGGVIYLEVATDGHGGYLTDTLVLLPGMTFVLNNANVHFQFDAGVDPLGFFNSGQFNLDTFFRVAVAGGGTDPFSDSFVLDAIFNNDTFSLFSPDFNVTNFLFSVDQGATAVNEFASGNAVPEPTTLALFGAGLAGAVASRRRKQKSA